MKKKNKKRLKIRIDRILIFLFCVAFLILVINMIFNIKIKNIYVSGNYYLKEQEIIEAALISDYPSSLKNSSKTIKKRLLENNLINNANVYKRGISRVVIEIEENRPLFYYENIKKTVLINGVDDNTYVVPTVINYITDKYYDSFILEMSKLDINILTRMSEIQFYPNDVDDNRFLITMNDGNYVYVNIETFNKLNKYLTILENLPNKKGILYLDYGNNFEIIS